MTQSLKCENEMAIEGTVIKIELKPPLPQIEKLESGASLIHRDKKGNNAMESSLELRSSKLFQHFNIDIAVYETCCIIDRSE